MEYHIPECVRECGARIDGVLRRDAGGVSKVICAYISSEACALSTPNIPFWSKINTRGV
jgi:hypothetical protein